MKMKNETALTSAEFAALLGVTEGELNAVLGAPVPMPVAPEAAPVVTYASLEALLAAA